jgi:dipeptidyl aminopeptidase/acylaminoacyl peptidase
MRLPPTRLASPVRAPLLPAPSRLAALVCAWALLSPPAGAEARARSFALEDVVAFKTIDGIAVSPDAQTAVFTVWSADVEGKRFGADLFIVRLDGSEPARRLTYAAEDDTAAKWSPDGSLIGFLSERGVTRQVWALRAAGGEAEPLTSHAEPVVSFDWAPDGKRLLVVARPAESEEDARRRKAGDDGFILGRHWRNAGLFVADASAGAAAGSASGAPPAGTLTPLGPIDGHVQAGAAWSPDGRLIAFITTPTPEVDAWEEAKIRIVEVSSGAVRDVPESARASSLSWSPDGRILASVRPFDGRGWSREDLFLWRAEGPPVAGGPVPSGGPAPAGRPASAGALPVNRSGALDRDVEAVLWDPAGRDLDILISRGTAHEIARIDVLKAVRRSGPPRPAWKPGHSLGSPRRAGAGWVYVPGGRPDEIWYAAPRSVPRRLTRINEAADGIELPSIETLHYRGPAADIEGILVKPPGHDPTRRYPLVLRVHGGPRLHVNDAFDPQIAYLASRGFLVLRPNPRGSTGYGDAFAKANAADWGDGPFRDVMAGADDLIARGLADPGRLFLYGWSYGGYMANWAATHTDRLRAAASGAGVADLRMQYTLSDARRWRFDYFSGSPFADHAPIYEKESPVTHAHGARVPALFIHGENDVRCPLAQGLMMHRALQDRGVPTEMVVYPREGHEFAEPRHVMDRIRRVADWFERHDAPPSPSRAP